MAARRESSLIVWSMDASTRMLRLRLAISSLKEARQWNRLPREVLVLTDTFPQVPHLCVS